MLYALNISHVTADCYVGVSVKCPLQISFTLLTQKLLLKRKNLFRLKKSWNPDREKERLSTSSNGKVQHFYWKEELGMAVLFSFYKKKKGRMESSVVIFTCSTPPLNYLPEI